MSMLRDDSPYFASLAEVDAYFDGHDDPTPIPGLIPYSARVSIPEGGKLLVCHDYKGGYREDPEQPSYTFNWWHLCDTFIYFAHHRVTIPPSGWVNTAHRQGVKILGTLIFEGRAASEVTKLLYNGLPPSEEPSRRYISYLVQLAVERGFDGYLMNFETPLENGVLDVAPLLAWILLLREELVRVLGNYAQVVWYDSVTINGRLEWQDRLNDENAAYFLVSSSIFTNYTWPPDYPKSSVSFLYALQADVATSQHSKPIDIAEELIIRAPSLNPALTKSPSDIFTGIDMFGRGSYGGGGFGAYRALQCIDPRSCAKDPQSGGTSVALFAPGWTWEHAEVDGKRDWDGWWEEDRSLWVGPVKDSSKSMPRVWLDEDSPPESPPIPGPKPEKPKDGPSVPFSEFFGISNPPVPSLTEPFYTTFSPGIGKRWFIRGVRQTLDAGWTDIDKQTSLGNLLWPVPRLLSLPANTTMVVHKAQDGILNSRLEMEDAWMAGSSLRLDINIPVQSFLSPTFGIPINSLTLELRTTYTASIVYKLAPKSPGSPESSEIDADRATHHIRPWISTSHHTLGVQITEVEGSNAEEYLDNGWIRVNAEFGVPKDNTSNAVSYIDAFIGICLHINSSSPASQGAADASVSLLLGQIIVIPTHSHSELLSNVTALTWTHTPSHQTSLLHTKSSPPEETPTSIAGRISIPLHGHHSLHELKGTLTWRTTSDAFEYRYFVVAVSVLKPQSNVDSSATQQDDESFVGTTVGNACVFHVEGLKNFDEWVEDSVGVRFIVRGVSLFGDILEGQHLDVLF